MDIVDGTTHWDNNNFANYFLPGTDARILPATSVSTRQTSSVPVPIVDGVLSLDASGLLLVRDLDYVKDVGIRYSSE